MELLTSFIDLFVHLDEHLTELVSTYGVLTYGILTAIIFAEVGLVVTPFLPGDSLLFAVGAIAATGALDLWLLLVLLEVAAIVGNVVNFQIGRWVGPNATRLRFVNQAHLEKTHQFFEKHGGKTIILARFLPIFRTFAPFVAGVGRMSQGWFLLYSVIGGTAWIFGFTLLGYFFGNLPIVEKNFSLVILGIVGVTFVPVVYEAVKHALERRSETDGVRAAATDR
ncbi:MAG: VTT domain-containing protein [Candidatus Sericytochromatia bacterium]|nr:VTT domain-containing protein [Candidatus Tanganyikabacteria bacterium]